MQILPLSYSHLRQQALHELDDFWVSGFSDQKASKHHPLCAAYGIDGTNAVDAWVTGLIDIRDVLVRNTHAQCQTR